MINEYEGMGELAEYLQEVYELIENGDKNKKIDEIDIVKYTLLLRDFIPETEFVNFMAELKKNGDRFLYNAKNRGLRDSPNEQHIQDSLHEHTLKPL